MLNDEAARTKKSLLKTQKICRFVRVTILIAFAILAVFEIVTIGSVIASFANQVDGIDVSRVVGLVLCIAYGLVAAAMFLVFLKMLSDVSKGDSPFSMIQVKRLRIISILLVVYGLIDNAASNLTSFTQFNGINSGYVSTGENAVFTVYLAPLIIAAIIFAFSFIFKYGVLLQELSDETL